MRYRVRTPDGELDYPSMGEVEAAYLQGLVGPEDEVLEEGHSVWRKAASLPTLARARPRTKGSRKLTSWLGVVIAVLMGLWALVLLTQESPTRRGLGLFLALGTAMMLGRVTYQAFKRPGTPKA